MLELVKAIIVSGVHDSKKGPRLEGDAASVDVLY